MAEVKGKKEVIEETELQTTFNQDTLEDLVEEGEVENVYIEEK